MLFTDYFNKNLFSFLKDNSQSKNISQTPNYLSTYIKVNSYLSKIQKTQTLTSFNVFFRKSKRRLKVKKEFKEDSIFRQLLYRYINHLLGSKINLVINKNLA